MKIFVLVAILCLPVFAEESAASHYERGASLLAGGHFDEAVAEFEQADRMEPLNPFVAGALELAKAGLQPNGISLLRWDLGTKDSEYRLADGAEIRTLTTRGLVISAALSETNQYYRVDVCVVNHTGARFDLRPANFVLEKIEGKSIALPYQSPQLLIETIRKRNAREQF